MSLKHELERISKHLFIFEGFPNPPEGTSQAAVLVLFSGKNFQDSKILLTLRAPNLATHSGQVAFPGGVAEATDQTHFQTALRECREEVGILEACIQTLGSLPGFPTVTGNFSVVPVLGQLLIENPKLVMEPGEVVRAEWVSVQELRESRFTEVRVVRGVERALPVFMWGTERMWGLSALIFDLILNRYDRL